MDAIFDNSLFQRHDLLIEIGKVEMALARLAGHEETDKAQLRSRLETHAARLRQAFDRLAA
ncbi:MAG TPA: hypothetical protein VHN99_02740 [Deinococcales bacterium]|nr:hypothetical protein [Deinococcales bacterium]